MELVITKRNDTGNNKDDNVSENQKKEIIYNDKDTDDMHTQNTKTVTTTRTKLKSCRQFNT